jgi:hypothetical protein
MRKANLDRIMALVPPAVGHVTTPEVWASMEPAERVELLTGRSLDNCKEILDFPIEAAIVSPALMTGKVSVIRSILTAITRVGIESSRLRQMHELLQGIIDDFADPPKETKEDQIKAGYQNGEAVGYLR